jgi:hypothetical protein
MIPGTIVRLLTGVPLAKDFINTMTFSDAAAQQTYFVSKQKGDMVFTDFSYQRKEGEMRVPVNAEHLHDINYLMFKNDNYSDKWFYCFVDSVEYKAENTALVRFTVDCWQTYLFDLDWKNSLIEREHVVSDLAGEHIVPENLDVGEMVIQKRETVTGLGELCVLIACTYNPYTLADVPARLYSGIYSGAGYFAFSVSNISGINSFIETLVEKSKSDAILAMFMYPKNLITSFTEGGLLTGQASAQLTKTFDMSGTLKGYTPKNKKLLTYPYNFIYVINNNGGVAMYKWEHFAGGVAQFLVMADIGPNPTVYFLPYYYKMDLENYDESLALTQYPFCAFTYDTYKDYLARNIVSAPLSIAATGLSLVGGVASKNPMAMAAGVVGLADTIGGFIEKSLLPATSKGTLSGAGAVAIGAQTFAIHQKCVNPKQAKVLDDFFTMYGYKTLRVGTPALKTRPYWNYLKLNEPNVFGSVPLDELDRIRSSLKTGITFWHDSDVGNYNRNNKY